MSALSAAETDVRDLSRDLASRRAPEPAERSQPECGGCLAWKVTSDRTGECRRDPPGATVSGFRVWPATDATDWCLEWVDREG